MAGEEGEAMSHYESLTERREATGLTGAHIAHLLGASRPSYSRWESGRRPWPYGLRELVENILTKYEDAATLAAPIAEQARRKVAA